MPPLFCESDIGDLLNLDDDEGDEAGGEEEGGESNGDDNIMADGEFDVSFDDEDETSAATVLVGVNDTDGAGDGTVHVDDIVSSVSRNNEDKDDCDKTGTRAVAVIDTNNGAGVDNAVEVIACFNAYTLSPDGCDTGDGCAIGNTVSFDFFGRFSKFKCDICALLMHL